MKLHTRIAALGLKNGVSIRRTQGQRRQDAIEWQITVKDIEEHK